ncbi:MAG: lipopolysaccharide kinase InaA family protein [Candidatus Brocadia sp.]
MDINTFISDGIRWSAKKEVSSDALKEMFQALHENKQCEIVRNGYYKKVLRYTHNQGSFYIKQYTASNWLEGVKSLFSLSKAQREWNYGHRLLRSQLHTAEPVAVGEKRRFGMLKDCYIISKAIPNSMTVKELLSIIHQSPAHVSGENTFLNDLISYVKTVHDHGIFHGELHAENILVDRDNTTLFYLLDLGRAAFKRQPPLSLRIQELSRLLYSLTDTCTDGEITELINNYASRLLAPNDREIFRKAVLKEIYKINRRLWRSRTRKCLKTNNVFKVATHANYKVITRNEWDVNTLAALIKKHMLSFEGQFDTIVKSSAKTRITRTPLSHEGIKSVCIKEYRYPSAWKRFLYSFQSSPARRAWVAAHGLMAANFRTPQPIAFFEEKRSGILKKSFIIMEDISACLPCNRYVSEKFSDCCNKATSGKKRRFISCLAMSFKHLHDSGTYHGDLKANNIMIKELTDTWDFFYLDLDRVSFHKKITIRKKVKNLSQLNASIPHCITYTDRLRFYRAYAGIKNLTKEDKEILRAIVQLSIQRKHVWNPKIPVAQISQIKNN